MTSEFLKCMARAIDEKVAQERAKAFAAGFRAGATYTGKQQWSVADLHACGELAAAYAIEQERKEERV